MTLENMAKIIEAEAGILDYNGKLAVANCIKYNNYSASAFTTPMRYYSPESMQAAIDSENGKRRFPGYKILQFRSFKKYSNGKGQPDNSKIYSGICPMPKEYIYLGADGKEPWGNMYYGVKIEIPKYTLKLTSIYKGIDKLNLRSTPEIKSDNIVGTLGYGGSYEVVEISADKNFAKLKSGVWVTANPKYVRLYEGEIVYRNYQVNVSNLNIRTGSGTDYSVRPESPIARGVYTIVEIKQGKGSDDGWGLLRSYQDTRDGWISLQFCKRVD